MIVFTWVHFCTPSSSLSSGSSRMVIINTINIQILITFKLSGLNCTLDEGWDGEDGDGADSYKDCSEVEVLMVVMVMVMVMVMAMVMVMVMVLMMMMVMVVMRMMVVLQISPQITFSRFSPPHQRCQPAPESHQPVSTN